MKSSELRELKHWCEDNIKRIENYPPNTALKGFKRNVDMAKREGYVNALKRVIDEVEKLELR